MNKNICVFTGTRAEYGCTYTEVEKDGFKIDAKVEMLLSSDTPVGAAKSMGLAVLGLADAFDRLRPDFLIILGDRYEALAAAQTAQILRIPVVHLSGGEVTEGAYDDPIRHAITKLSYLHFTSNQRYCDRVIQLGEAPDRVFNAGSIGLEHLSRTQLLSLEDLSLSLGFELTSSFFVVTYHSATLADEDPEVSFRELLSGLECFPEHKVLLTYPNADDGGRKIISLLEQYLKNNAERVCVVKSLGQQRYLSAIKLAAAVIGNSSSGIAEVPSFSVPTVNIGARQKGRLMAKSIINCEPNANSIVGAINVCLSTRLKGVVNPYGAGETSNIIIKQLVERDSREITKQFYDVEAKV